MAQMYLYNGFTAQKLPERDKETFPYAVIHVNEHGIAFLFYCAEKPYYTEDGMNYPMDGTEDIDVWMVGNIYQGNWVHNGFLPSKSNIPSWADFDVLNEDGTLYLPATAPIPVSTATTWKYNGVELPALPEVDWGTYRFALIHLRADGAVYLTVGTTLWMKDSYGTISPSVSGFACRYICPSDGNEWTEIYFDKEVNGDDDYITSDAIWSNHNILNTDGTTYLALSTPEPVVPEAPFSFHLKSFLMGVVDELAGRPSIV